MSVTEIARWLDARGITAVNVIDPVDGSTIPAVHLRDLENLIAEHEKLLRQHDRPWEDEVRHVSPMPSQVLRRVEIWDDYGEVSDVRPVATDIREATIITSEVKHPVPALFNTHKIVLDIDHPIKVVPSTTPGHGHLYIDHELSWDDYVKLMQAMVDVGLLEEGYLGVSKTRGFTALRLPWIKKGDEVHNLNGYSIRCIRCERAPDALDEYVAIARENGWEKTDGRPDADMAVRREEGTYNTANGRFYCTECYIRAGQPQGVAA